MKKEVSKRLAALEKKVAAKPAPDVLKMSDEEFVEYLNETDKDTRELKDLMEEVL